MLLLGTDHDAAEVSRRRLSSVSPVWTFPLAYFPATGVLCPSRGRPHGTVTDGCHCAVGTEVGGTASILTQMLTLVAAAEQGAQGTQGEVGANARGKERLQGRRCCHHSATRWERHGLEGTEKGHRQANKVIVMIKTCQNSSETHYRWLKAKNTFPLCKNVTLSSCP